MFQRFLLVAAVLLCHTAAALAQGVTTGTIVGTVTGRTDDATNPKPLVAATVRANHIGSGAMYGGFTRGEGKFTIRGLRPGVYDVVVSFLGFRQRTIAGVRVEVGETQVVNIELQADTKTTDAVTVTASREGLDGSKSGSSSVISEAQITAAPTINRSISDFARMNPYTQQSESPGSDGLSGVSVMGVNSRYNNFQIDGAVANDVFALGTAGTAGSQANSNFISLDAIERLRVNVSPYDVRQSGFTGGLINAITRGGTNEFHGSVFFYGRNELLVGPSPDAYRAPFADFQDFQFGGRLGGPIIKDKLLFHVTAEGRLRSTPLDVAVNDPNALNNFPVPASTLDQIIQASKDRYGYDPGGYDTFNNRNNTFNIIGRLDWNIDESNKIQLRHNYTYAIQDRNLTRTNATFSLENRVNVFESINNQFVAQWDAIIGSSMSNQLRFSYTRTEDQRILGTPFPEVRITVSSGQSVLLGEERNSHANALDQTVIAITDDFSIFAGDHTITIGTNNEFYGFDNLFIADYLGTYQYPSVSAFADSTANNYQVSYANLDVTGTPTPRAAWSMMQAGVYVMDEWEVNQRLRLTGGLRVDVPIYLDKPYDNPLFAQRFPGYSTSAVPENALMFSPRFGFNYDVSGDRTLQIRGGTGVFTGRVAAVWLSNQYSNTGVDLFRATLGAFNSQNLITDPATGLPMKWDLTKAPLHPGDPGYPGSPINTSAINITADDFKMPQVWRSTLGGDLRLMKGLTFTLEGMYGKFLNTVDYANLNLKPSGRSWVVDGNRVVGVSPVDGRPLYASASNADSLVAKEFTQVILLRSRDAGYQYSISGQLELSPNNDVVPGLSAMFSYTYGRSEDLNSSVSATASSQWQFNDAIDPNNATVGRSNFDVPHRVVLNASYRITWTPDIATTIGAFYDGSSGRPYSLSYIQDYNGDNASGGNDLVYIPRAEDYNTKVVIEQPTGTDLRTKDQVWEQLMALIDANPILKEYQGQILPRNFVREPWRNRLDLRITQDLPGPSTHKISITWDIQNLLNLFNPDWGLTKYVSFQSANLFGLNTSGNTPFDAQGRLRMTYSEPVTNGQNGIYTVDNFYSRWRMQLGVRYTF
jgi:outer membrane receptor for ferrienterochelin and colicin